MPANAAPGQPPAALVRQPRQKPRTLAGATILQIIPALGEEPLAHAAVDTALTLLQSGARAIMAGDGGALVGELRAFGGEWIPLASESYNPVTLRRNARTLRDIITSERVDIVHAQSAAAAWSARKAVAKLPVRLVTSFGDRLDTPSWLGRHFQAALSEEFADAGDDLFVDDGGFAGESGDGFAGEVVVGGADATGADHHVSLRQG